MDKSTLDAISSALSYLSTPVGSGSVIVDASKGQVFSAALGATQTLVSFGEMMGKRLPIAGSALAYSALGRDFLNMKTTIDDSGEVHVSDIYSVFADLSAIVASATLAAAVGAASAPALIATAVVITAAGAVLTVMAMNSGDESIDLNPYIDSLSNALHGLGEVLGEAYTSAIESFQDAMEATGDFAQAFNDYVVGALDDITDAVSSSIFNFTDLIVENLRDAYDAALNTVSPLILDLDGDGVETLSLSSGVYFDHDGNGFAESTGWVGKDDGLLIWDRNGNGQIDDGSELFGNYTHLTNGQIATNGFSVLADLDSNHDGKIDANDAAFGQLGVWKDSNSDAKLDEGELLSLGEANVQSLSVGYVDENTTDSQGNKVLQSGTYTDSSGASHDLDDVWFVVDTARTVDLNKIVLGEQTASSIDLDGFGNVADLSQAILRDTTGHLKQLVEQFAVETDTTKRYSLLDQIIFSWSGAAAYTSVSRGGYIDDGRKLYALEAFSGQGFIQSAGINVGTGNPGPNAAAKLMQAYGQLAGFLYSGLMLQTHFRPLVEAIDLGFENYELKFDVARLVEMLRFAYDEDSALGAQEMSEFSKALLDSGVQGGAILTNLRQAGDVNVPGFDCLLANMGYSLGGLINDELYGDSHNNALFGLAGRDTLYGDAGNDILDGGADDDYLSGDEGSDIYRFSRGWGHDTLNNFDSGDNKVDFIEFASDIAPSEIGVTRSGDDLVLVLRGGADRIKVVNYFYSDGASDYYLEEIRFADGAIWRLEQIKAMVGITTPGDDEIHGYASSDNLSGGLGNDKLFGAQGDDVLIGGGGNDYIEGGTGSDVYHFNLGDGRDVINEDVENLGDSDVLYFGEGICPADINVSIQGSSLLLQHGNGHDQVVFLNWFIQLGSRYQVERIEFADGTFWMSSELTSSLLNRTGTEFDDVITGASSRVSQTFLGGGGNDNLTTGAGDDQLEGGTGNDILNGAAGSDIYLFNVGDGQDVINDDNISYYYGGVDVLRFGTGIQVSDIMASRSGTSLVLRHINGQDQVTVTNWFTENTDRYQLERIEFADGTVWTSSVLSAQLLQLMGGAGDDVLTGIGAAFKQVLSGGGGNDTLTAGVGDDQLEGGVGNDTLNGGQGSDLYLFSLGDGRDVINDDNLSYMYGGVDVLRFGTGIQAADILASRSGTSLVLSHVNGQDQVTVTNWFTENTDRYQLERIEFADGTVWTSAALSVQVLQLTGGAGDDVLTGVSSSQAQVIRGGGGNDTLTAGAGADQLEGGTGNDTLNGGQGSDLYLFNLGDGRDVINDDNLSYMYGGVDVLRFGTGIQAADIIASRSGTSLVLSHVNGQDQITVTNWFTENTGRYQLERIEFADGTVWTSTTLSAQLLQLTGGAGDDVLVGIGAAFKQVLSGGGGNDTLTAGSGDDQLAGGTGNDTLNGGQGSDIYLFNLGDGRDVINDDNLSYMYGGVDILRFGMGIQASDIVASRSGTSLVLSHANGQDQVTVTNWFTENTDRYQLERIEFTDGTVWTSATLSAQMLQLTGGAGDDVLTGVSSSQSQVIRGGGGNDTLTAGSGNDLLEGGTGNDTLNGGQGSDLYLFSLGDGRDVINDDNISYYYGGVDVLRFGTGIQVSDISASRSGTSLVLSHINGQDQVTVTNWFTENTGRYQLE
ncbi:calcium-binding protein, partial [Pseudomonas corrugata]|uniref:calcium-binding protein n=2 Tax=Pseudomonas corrugata TaxID=47879 RepID=UPI0017D89BF6|nr:hypothetical protein [Pseudomonas corrugata]